ncbi:hypothetical protein RhiirA4_461848 [Rhizophagus irregularis]|uniref:Uncharacterized protein n=1 Tax=Rhizophagus irregularis TaxID=588596 RepID=A0A2I1GJP9_9GLOM|nr:hypothetical protein RhiirA4_461848 [Rhizophagus irregularis]
MAFKSGFLQFEFKSEYQKKTGYNKSRWNKGNWIYHIWITERNRIKPDLNLNDSKELDIL